MNEITTDRRFTLPLYSISEASRYLRLPRQTLVNWADGYSTGAQAPVVGAPLVTAVASKGQRSQPRLPFIGIAEAYVLNVFRRAGVPLQRIRPSLDVLKGRARTLRAGLQPPLYRRRRSALEPGCSRPARHSRADQCHEAPGPSVGAVRVQ